MSYLIAFGANLNAIDSKGLTPLHISVKTYKEHVSAKGIKQLLVKGADRNALDFNALRPLDYVAVA